LRGSVEATTVSGNVRFEGSPSVARLNTVSGDVTFSGASPEVRANTVSGSVRVTSTVPMTSGTLNTVSGNVYFDGSLARGANLEAKSHSGNVDAALRGTLDARLHVSTFSGRVTSDLPGTEIEQDRRRGRPGHSQTLTLGGGAGRIDLSTFSGNVRVRPGG
jgi:DUF4097 and DUF4098 domain-containing protein YvlB